MMSDVAIDVANLTKYFGDYLAVDRVTLHIKKGEVFAFLGPNGSGKTTTLRMLCGLLTPDQGQGTCLQYDILKDTSKIKSQVGYMTQRYSFYEDLTIEENLNFIARVYALSHAKQRVHALMQEMGLWDRRQQLTGELSGGWKQRVALTACLLHEPKLLLLDEPTAGVDPMARRLFWDTVHALSEQGMTTLVSTHYMEEALYCTRLAYLAYSKLVVTGTVPEVIQASQIQIWQVTGAVTMSLLQRVKQLDGVTEATLLEGKIRVCASLNVDILMKFNTLEGASTLRFDRVDATLEDAFIALVHQSTRSAHAASTC